MEFPPGERLGLVLPTEHTCGIGWKAAVLRPSVNRSLSDRVRVSCGSHSLRGSDVDVIDVQLPLSQVLLDQVRIGGQLDPTSSLADERSEDSHIPGGCKATDRAPVRADEGADPGTPGVDVTQSLGGEDRHAQVAAVRRSGPVTTALLEERLGAKRRTVAGVVPTR